MRRQLVEISRQAQARVGGGGEPVGCEGLVEARTALRLAVWPEAVAHAVIKEPNFA